MKALIVDATWEPKKEYTLKREEQISKKAFIGSQVWRYPRFEIRDIPVPEIREDQVLIKVRACGICGSDTHLYETDKDGYIIFSGLTKLPSIAGHEFSGIITKIGERVTAFNVGDKVAVESIMWCGVCEACKSGSPNQCRNIELMGLSANGAFSEYIAVNIRYCWNINELSNLYTDEEVFDIGALIEPIGCAYNGMFVAGGGFMPGATVVVYGTGPIGLGAIALAKTAGASLIIGFDVVDERVDLAMKLGADYTYNINNIRMEGRSPSDIIKKLTNGSGAEVQIEAAGAAPSTIPEMEKSMSVNGKIIYLGRAATSTPMLLDTLVSGANRIIGARGHSGYGIFPNIIKLIASGKMDVRKMITARYPFDNIIEAFQASIRRSNGKILIELPQ